MKIQNCRMLFLPLLALCGTHSPLLTAADEATGAADTHLAAKGRYLAAIGACAACHTPAKKPTTPAEEFKFRSDPDWLSHLDHERHLAGGVPFILRFGPESHGLVVTSNITPDNATGIGSWKIDQIVECLRTGARPNGPPLFRFPPHTFYENLALEDLEALAHYLKTLTAVNNKVQAPDLPVPTVAGNAAKRTSAPPRSRGAERAEYLMEGLVGCVECHSHHDPSTGKLKPFTGGRIGDAFVGGFRLGPDLPINQTDKGLAAWPYPGYALLYGGNLTRLGLEGDRSSISATRIVESMRGGVSLTPDSEGRPRPLAHTMLWQFYSAMNDTDAYSIAEYIKALRFEQGPLDNEDRLLFFGTSAAKAFETFFGSPPSEQDAAAFGFKINKTK